MTVPDDEALVCRARAGSHGSFAELVRRHQGRVRGLLWRLCGDTNLADDLAQEVFLRAYRGLAGFEGRARFGSWLYRIGYNLFLNHRERARRFVALPAGYDATAAAPDDRSSARGTDLRHDLCGALALLPDNYRAILLLYYAEDRSYPAIAEVLGLPLGTVKTHLHRAKRLLREVWLDDGAAATTNAPGAWRSGGVRAGRAATQGLAAAHSAMLPALS